MPSTSATMTTPAARTLSQHSDTAPSAPRYTSASSGKQYARTNTTATNAALPKKVYRAPSASGEAVARCACLSHCASRCDFAFSSPRTTEQSGDYKSCDGRYAFPELNKLLCRHGLKAPRQQTTTDPVTLRSASPDCSDDANCKHALGTWWHHNTACYCDP